MQWGVRQRTRCRQLTVDQSARVGLAACAATMKLKVILPTFFWFKHTCVMSWVIIVLSTVTACLNIAALTSCNDIRNQVPHLCPIRAVA